MFMTEIDGIEVKEILKFPPAPGFGRFKAFFDGSSLAHPAKMHVELCAELIRRYTKPGDVVLDPMNGVGTTTILCVLLGRNAIGVELEEKFHNWCEKSRKITEEKIRAFLGALKKRPPVTGWCECNPTEDSYEPAMDVKNPDEVIEKFPIKIETCEKCGKPIYPRFGKAIHICGDARKLSTILKEHEEEVRCVLFSPPYASSFRHNPQDKEKRLKRLREVEEQAVKEGRKWALSSDEALERQVNRQDWGYGDDERNIGNLSMGDVGSILFSPPYSLGHDSGDNASERYKWRLDEQRKHTRAYSEGNNIAKLPHGEVDSVIFSPPYSTSLSINSGGMKGKKNASKEHTLGSDGNPQLYSNNLENIGNLPHGNIDIILTSPPFGQAQKGGGIAQKGYDGQYGRDERHHLRHDRPLSDRKDNISNLPYGVNCVITSPPYSETLNEKKNTTSNLRREERLRTAGHQPKDFLGGIARNCQLEDGMRYSFNPQNIGNLKHGDIDVVLTSPPYEESMGDKHHSPRGDEIVREKRHYNTYTEAKKKDNIGNLRKETYHSAMLTVYEQCHLVLKQGGKMIVIVKPFVRNFKVVKLHEHTIKLCELAGFVLKEVLLFKLPQQSFWRILYKKKHGSKVKNLDLLDYEWVLVFEKP